jgi:nitrite reductase/ring-hydroxylating ferredoxin subunit
LSAAHELAERGYDVTVYEKKDMFGGKARSLSVPNTATAGRKDLPGEYGFRFFPRFYKHLPDTMMRIPFPGNGSVFKNLVNATRIEVARSGNVPLVLTARIPREAELPDDGCGLTFEIGSRRVALFRHEGRVHAIDDQCPHQGASLGMGIALAGEVTCPWHAWHFDLTTGQNTDGLAACVAVFPLRVGASGTLEVGLEASSPPEAPAPAPPLPAR